MLVLKTMDLLLKSVSVRMLPLVPSSYSVVAIVSSTVFETKCSDESSVRQISASICLANSCTSSKMF